MENRFNSTCIQARRESNMSESVSGTFATWNPLVITITVILVVLSILTSFGNFLVCRTVWVCRRLQIPPFYFLTSLSFSDFLVGLLVIPLSLAYHVTFQTSGRWIFGRFTCNLWLYLNFILCIASIFNLCAVSGDRYLAVTSPLNYLSRMNGRTVKQVVAFSWFCALFLAGFIVYGLNASTDVGTYCAVWGLRFKFVMVVLVAGYILPVMFLVFVNARLFCIARSHVNRIHAQETSLAVISEPKSLTENNFRTVRSQKSRLKQEMKIFKTFLIVTLTFLLSWTPFIVILLLDSLASVPTSIRHSSIIILYSNSAMNPFIYGFFNSEFRKALLETFNCKCTRRKTRVENMTKHVQKEAKEHMGT